MDEREERVVKTRSTAGTQQNKTRRRPRRIAGEPEDTRMDSNRIPPSKSCLLYTSDAADE